MLTFPDMPRLASSLVQQGVDPGLVHDALSAAYGAGFEAGRNCRTQKAGGPLPEDWEPSFALLCKGRKLGLSDDRISELVEDMRTWARANANRAIARKADWDATFLNWMRSSLGKTRRPTTRNAFFAMAERL